MGGKGGGRGGVVVWPVVRSDGQRGHRHPLGYCHPLGRMGRPLPPRETPYLCDARVEAPTPPERQQRHWPVLSWTVHRRGRAHEDELRVVHALGLGLGLGSG